MSKVATIASLVRSAARSEEDFVSTIEDVFVEADPERIAEFFDRLNIPRSQGFEGPMDLPLTVLESEASRRIWSYAEEAAISDGMQKFLDRHQRKIKWHAGHPSLEGTQNVLLLFRATMMVTALRLVRLRLLLASQEELTPVEWSTARITMNQSFLSFRNFLQMVAADWMDALHTVVERQDVAEQLGSFYELVDAEVQKLEIAKEALEERRRELTVVPEGYLPVKPPIYFHGDLLGKGPWKLFWTKINASAHQFREAVG